MTGTNCDLFTHNQSRSYLNHLVQNTSTFHRCQQKAAHPYRATLYTRDAIRFYDFSLALSYENIKRYNIIRDVIMFQLQEYIYGSSPMLCFRLWFTSRHELLFYIRRRFR